MDEDVRIGVFFLYVLGVPGLFLVAALAGELLAGRHLRSLREREAASRAAPMGTVPHHAEASATIASSRLVMGSAVISLDLMKHIVSDLMIHLGGGGIDTYQSLLDRARREAVLRMQAQVSESERIINVRIETSMVSVRGIKGNAGCVEALAYGTAVPFQHT